MRFFLLLTFSFSAVHSAALADPIGNYEAISEYLKLLQPSTNCGESVPAPYENSGDEAIFWRGISCQDLFSSVPPPNHPGASALSWRPLCSVTRINKNLHTSPNSSFEKAIQEEHQNALQHDLCAQGAKAYLEDDAGYKPHSQNEQHITPMTLEDRIAYQKLIEQIRDETSQSCCGNDSECARWFKKVRISFCVPEEDPAKPDPCTEDGTYFNVSDASGLQKFYRGKIQNLTLPRGEIDIAPLKVESTGTPNDNVDTIVHELGHACSFARRILAVKHGDRAAYDQVKVGEGSAATYCKLSPAVVKTYSDLYLKLGLSSATFQCASKYSASAVDNRFVDGQCEKGCPMSAIEEGLADTLALKNVHTNAGTLTLDDFCRGLRDNEHPLASDVLACALKTPSIDQRVREWTGCR